MPRHPSVYGNLLKERIAKGGVDCWLVNPGCTGGQYGTGSRMPIKVTPPLLNAALDGSLNDPEFRIDESSGFTVPVPVPGSSEGHRVGKAVVNMCRPLCGQYRENKKKTN